MTGPRSDEKERLHLLFEEVRARVSAKQNGICTYFDNWLINLVCLGGPRDEASVRHLDALIARHMQGRWVKFSQRHIEVEKTGNVLSDAKSDIPADVLLLSQGIKGPVQWRGLPLFKSAFDFALYTQLLGEMRPETIIELGSGTGASAMWFADICAILGQTCRVISLDRVRPPASHPAVDFIVGDCADIKSLITKEMLDRAPHPILVVEDAHVYVDEVLMHFAEHLALGDRIVVEDAHGKQAILAAFAKSVEDRVLVDTFYTDFFGWNATSAANAFFVRV